MKLQDVPFRRMIFVCTNKRGPDERISCAGENRCGQEILDRLKSRVNDKKLKNVVRVMKSGCQEQCEFGPALTVYPENKMLVGIQPNDVDEIIRKFIDSCD